MIADEWSLTMSVIAITISVIAIMVNIYTLTRY